MVTNVIEAVVWGWGLLGVNVREGLWLESGKMIRNPHDIFLIESLIYFKFSCIHNPFVASGCGFYNLNPQVDDLGVRPLQRVSLVLQPTSIKPQ